MEKILSVIIMQKYRPKLQIHLHVMLMFDCANQLKSPLPHIFRYVNIQYLLGAKDTSKSKKTKYNHRYLVDEIQKED